MFSLFSHKKSLIDSGLLEGATDNHSHILYGVDDGVKTVEESLAILAYLEEKGFRKVWLTPHTMEDVPNTTEGLKKRFAELKAVYSGGIELHLASEYMMDNLFAERLRARDLLTHGDDTILVETSTWSPPLDFWEMMDEIMRSGYRPILAHPERYRYMQKSDYQKLHDMGVVFQLNLPSLVGAYGGGASARAQEFLDKGWYSMTGSDCHRFSSIRHQYGAEVLKSSQIKRLRDLMIG